MRILMLSHGYPPTISGVTLVVQKVAREMVARGHQVTLIAASDRGSPYEDEDQGVQLIRVRSGTNPFWSEGRLPLMRADRLQQIVREVQPDVINTHDSALLGWQVSRMEHQHSDIPEVLTAHFLPRFVTHYVHAGETVDRVIEEITWEVALRMINEFDHVVFPTATQQAAFVAEGLEPPSSVISNGIDVGRYMPGEPDPPLVRRYQLLDGPRFLFVGRLALDKKLDVLIRALAMLDDGSLILAGRGDDRERLEDLAEELDVSDRVQFLGFVPEEDLPDLYRASEVFVIASDVEVQSIPTLQAAATGLPIVAADAAALPEIVHDGQNGYLVPIDDPQAIAEALDKLLSSPTRRAVFGKASLAIGKQHANQATLDAYEQLYRSVANHR